MNSQRDATADVIRSRDATNNSPLDRHTIASTSSSNPRQSFGHSETGESSRAASKRDSFTTGYTDGTAEDSPKGNGKLGASKPGRDGRGSHRSHRSRASGGFLLSNSTYESPSVDMTKKTLDQDYQMRQRPSVRDRKGKNSTTDIDKKHSKYQSKSGVRLQSSPLAGNAGAVPSTQGQNESSTIAKEEDAGQDSEKPRPVAGLDVDSAQIVNLALNLNESRRNAARRNISTPLPPLTQGFAEEFTGGSLRHHLQQQRRVSRNISPKPARGERAVTTTPRVNSSQKLNSALQPAFEPDGNYKYHFSASTLARAEKAKNTIKLMAQYRRLLQYVPPLKPQPERDRRSESAATPGSPRLSALNSRVASSSITPLHPLGRPYNPLQYVRNRKVRLRTGRAIDGVAQGFGELDRVSSWVDQVSKESSLPEYQGADCLYIPAFSRAAEEAASPHTSPESHSKGHATAPKIKRPRNDWTTSPADMLADLYWMEQDDNKKMIEDSHGRKIFPPKAELRRPASKRSNDPESHFALNHSLRRDDSGPDLRIDTKLPDFKSIKPEPEWTAEGAASKAKEKLRQVRDAARAHHGHNGSINEYRQAVLSHSRSDSNSESDSNHLRRSRRRRSGTMDSNDRATDILEKQMTAMLQREAHDREWKFPSNSDNRRLAGSSESQKSELRERLESIRDAPASHTRSGSIVNIRNRDSALYSSSGRASLEVPGAPPRRSLEELHNTAPISPDIKSHKLSNAYIPSILMDISPPRSRRSSPVRTPLSKVKAKMNPFHGSSKDRSSNRLSLDESPAMRLRAGSTDPLPETSALQEKRQRSLSPIKKLSSRMTDDGIIKPPLKKSGSVRKGKPEESTIKGLFKSRNPVTRVSDFIWKNAKEQLPGLASGFSTDESDVGEFGPILSQAKKSDSRASSVGLTDEDVAAFKNGKSTYSRELPSFTSPFEGRGRPIRSQKRDSETRSDTQTREAASPTARASRPEPLPRIDVHNASPTSSPSPDSGHPDRVQRDSSVSDVEYRRAIPASGAHLNEILGPPGKRRNALPTTGLSHLEVSESRRHWSISDQGISVHRGPMTKREIARVRALLLSSGIKAQEISRRAEELQDLCNAEGPHYAGIAALAHESIVPVPRREQHILAARILSNDVQLSSHMWQTAADIFVSATVPSLFSNIQALQTRLADTLTPMTRKASDEADEVSKDLVAGQTLQVKRLTDKIDVMMRRRKRRFRWLRRGGWVIVEWALVGIMWYVWFMVMIARIGLGIGNVVVGVLRWLFWL